MFEKKTESAPPAPDDLSRNLTIADVDDDQSLPHIGLVGDTYTITVRGENTKGRFCVIDMHIPPGGGPPPHRHDFEETFILLERGGRDLSGKEVCCAHGRYDQFWLSMPLK